MDNINIEDYAVPEDEKDMQIYVNLLNIYLVYFKTMYNKNESYNIFSDINQNDETSTNDAIIKLYDEIHRYKQEQNKNKQFINLFELDEYKKLYLPDSNSKINEDYPLYMVYDGSRQYLSHNLITILLHLTNIDWHNIDWSINQINEL